MTSTKDGRGSLTGEQRQFLEMAQQEGYFNVPREVSLNELGEESSISSQEASELLREGLNIAVRNQVADGERTA